MYVTLVKSPFPVCHSLHPTFRYMLNDLTWFLITQAYLSDFSWSEEQVFWVVLRDTKNVFLIVLHNPYCLVWMPVVVLCASKSKALCGGFTKQSRSPTDCHLLQYNVLWPKWGRDYTVYTTAGMWCVWMLCDYVNAKHVITRIYLWLKQWMLFAHRMFLNTVLTIKEN